MEEEAEGLGVEGMPIVSVSGAHGMKKVERFCFFYVEDISICVNECSLPVIFPGRHHELESRSSYLIKRVWESSCFIILWNSLCKAELLCSLKV